MRAIFRIFNQCFDGGEWFVTTTIPDDFAHNLQLNDIISTPVLMSFKEFNCARTQSCKRRRPAIFQRTDSIYRTIVIDII